MDTNKLSMVRRSYEDRLRRCENPLLKKLFKIIIEKKTNLCVSAHFDTIEEIIRFVDRVGKHICMVRIRCLRFGTNINEILRQLYAKKKEFNFLILDDQNFCQEREHIERWYNREFVECADIVTVIPCYGDGFEAIESVVRRAGLPEDEPRGCLGSWETPGCIVNRESMLNLAKRNKNICVGIMALEQEVTDDDMIKVTPDYYLSPPDYGKTRPWNHPSKLFEHGADVIVVDSRHLDCSESEQEETVRRYKEAAFEAYYNSLKMEV